SSAVGMFFGAQAPIIAAGLTIGNGSTCPTKTGTDADATYTGGCTDSSGNQWFGTATSNQAGVSYGGFGYSGTTDCNGVKVAEEVHYGGGVDVVRTTDGGFTFDIDVTLTGTFVESATCTSAQGHGAMLYKGDNVLSGPDTDGNGTPDR